MEENEKEEEKKQHISLQMHLQNRKLMQMLANWCGGAFTFQSVVQSREKKTRKKKENSKEKIPSRRNEERKNKIGFYQHCNFCFFYSNTNTYSRETRDQEKFMKCDPCSAYSLTFHIIKHTSKSYRTFELPHQS